MSKQKEEFAFEAMQDPRAIVEYLRALMRGFEDGSLTFRGNGDVITLIPEGLIHMDLQASRKSDRCKLSLRFAWRPQSGDSSREVHELEIDSSKD